MARCGQCVCDMIMLFQAILQHLFAVLMGHIADVNAKEGVFSVKFSASMTRRKLSLSFWEGNELL